MHGQAPDADAPAPAWGTEPACVEQARKDYHRMSEMAEQAFAGVDLDAARDQIRARVGERYETVESFFIWAPPVLAALGVLAWLGLEEPTPEAAWRAVAIFGAITTVSCLAVACWWRWHRIRATRVLRSGPETARRWLNDDARSVHRERRLGALCTAVVFLFLCFFTLVAISEDNTLRAVLSGLGALGVAGCLVAALVGRSRPE